MILIESLMYESYKAQRDSWFDPYECSAKTYKAMQDWFKNLELYESKYLKEVQNECRN